MRSIHTGVFFRTDEVKPLAGLLEYRRRCLDATDQLLAREAETRMECPLCGGRAERLRFSHPLAYRRCLGCGSIFLERVPPLEAWTALSEQVAGWLYTETDDGKTAALRRLHVYEPKVDWIADSVQLFAPPAGRAIAVSPARREFDQLWAERMPATPLHWVSEAALVRGAADARLDRDRAAIAILLEGLDRSRDPVALVRAIAGELAEGGLLFLTALLASGFELLVLDEACVYVFPPDKAHCLSLTAIETLLKQAGFELLESSTPGVLDCDSVARHLKSGVPVPLSRFEQAVLSGSDEDRGSFQQFLQLARLSSFGRFVARRVST